MRLWGSIAESPAFLQLRSDRQNGVPALMEQWATGERFRPAEAIAHPGELGGVGRRRRVSSQRRLRPAICSVRSY